MAQSFFYRAHEWLADNVKWVQYPNVSAIKRPLFTTAMPWSTRVMLVLVGVITIAVCAVALFFLGVFFWAVIKA